MRLFVEGANISIERDDGTVITFTDEEREALGLNARTPAGRSQSSLYPSKKTSKVDDVLVTTDVHHTVVAIFFGHGPLETGLVLLPELARRLQTVLAAKIEVVDASAPTKCVQ